MSDDTTEPEVTEETYSPSRLVDLSSGLTAPYGLMAKRAAKRRAREESTVEPEPEGGEDEPDETESTGDTTEPENEPETGAEDSGEEPEEGEEPVDEGYDPAAHTVAEVQKYLSENPDQEGYVLDRERAGKARTTLIGA